MSRTFEELDRRMTPMGEISLRRRLEPTLQIEVYEVMLGDEHLMSNVFTVAETQLAKLALAELGGGDLDVVVGGLGLGYTAVAALEDPRVRSLHIVEALAEVIEWHDHHALPNSEALTSDPRCNLVIGDFFEMIATTAPFGPRAPELVHAVLLDIDHTPRHVLHPSHESFYERRGLQRLAERLLAGGVFALWADDPPDQQFLAVASDVFESCEAHVVTFPNFHTGGEGANTVYVAKTASAVQARA